MTETPNPRNKLIGRLIIIGLGLLLAAYLIPMMLPRGF